MSWWLLRVLWVVKTELVFLQRLSQILFTNPFDVPQRGPFCRSLSLSRGFCLRLQNGVSLDLHISSEPNLIGLKPKLLFSTATSSSPVAPPPHHRSFLPPPPSPPFPGSCFIFMVCGPFPPPSLPLFTTPLFLTCWKLFIRRLLANRRYHFLKDTVLILKEMVRRHSSWRLWLSLPKTPLEIRWRSMKSLAS